MANRGLKEECEEAGKWWAAAAIGVEISSAGGGGRGRQGRGVT